MRRGHAAETDVATPVGASRRPVAAGSDRAGLPASGTASAPALGPASASASALASASASASASKPAQRAVRSADAGKAAAVRASASGAAPAQAERLVGLPPVIGPRTRLLVLGSFPSAASLAAGVYYAHPRNQFWRLLSALWGLDLAALAPARRHAALLDRGLGLWDVYGACRRAGSLDRAIRDAEPNDLAGLRRHAPRLEAVAHNGATSARAAQAVAALGLTVHRLPSTSPAHAAWTFERKLAAWRAAFERHGLLP